MNVVQVDAYEASLHGRHLRWLLTKESAHMAHYPPGFTEQISTESPPFLKKFLLCSQTSNEAWKLVDRWDAIFMPSAPTDWSLLLAFLQHYPQALVVAATDCQIPAAFFQKCRQLKSQPTIVCFQTLKEDSYKPLATAYIAYDDTFFPQIKEETLESAQYLLQQIVQADTFKQLSLKETIRDLKGAGASLVASRSGGLYWYYMSERTPPQTLINSVVQTLIQRNV